jgi:hypothetical protein
MTFPFPVPEDLTALSAAEFAAFVAQVREFAETTLADDNASPELLVETQTLFTSVTGEETRRTELAASADAARTALRAGLAPATAPTEPEPAPVPPVEPAPVPVAVAPAATTASTIETPPQQESQPFAVMVASADAGNAGAPLADFAAATSLIERRLATYGTGTRARGADASQRRIGGGQQFRIGGRSLIRHGNVAIQRQFPDELRIRDNNKALSVLDYASSQSRLPGGSLIASMERQIAAGKSLTAAAGWCAPSETIYDLCRLDSMDGILDLPEVQTARGGFFIPSEGGPDFASIYDAIGDDGDVILTEYDVQNGVDKVCTEIPCPEFDEVRMDVAYICLTGSLLQDRGYPEAVAQFSQTAMTALAHKVNESIIARMVAQSGAPITIAADASGDDAVSALLSAVELAIEDIKYRHRMARAETLEVVLPYWVRVPMRAALARRQGIAMFDVTDAMILNWFTIRGAVVHFVYDWQDAFSGQASGPGALTPKTTLPATVNFLIYPSGTWVKQSRDVINLDTVYDNALLTQNQYTALFAEDGFNVMKMCRGARLYTAAVDPSGVTGCCP